MYRRSHISQSTPVETETVSEALRKLSLPKSAIGEQKKKPTHKKLKACPHCRYPVTEWGPLPVPVFEEVAQTQKLKQHQFTAEFLRSVWPRYHQPPTTLAGMNEKETAIWIEMLASFKGWKEAKTYSKSFKSNCVTGYVLPYLSVKALKSELDIIKFGHRLEIVAAIENSELTLLNPVIVSIRSDAFFMSTKNINNRNSQWIKKLETDNSHAREVSKWLTNMPRKPSMFHNNKESGSINSWSTSNEDDWTSDPEPHSTLMFEGSSIWTLKKDPYNNMTLRSGNNSEKSNRVKTSKFKCKQSLIHPSKETTAISDQKGNKTLEDMTFELVRGSEERLNAIFANSNCETTATCERKVNNSNSWDIFSLMGDVNEKLQSDKKTCFFE